MAVDKRVVCPRDVKKVLLKQARMIQWRRWAAKHECEELKERVRLEPVPSHAAKKDQRIVGRQATQCRKLVGGRRMGAEKIV